MKTDIEVRPLIVEDVFTVARMLSKITKGARAELALALSSKKSPNPTELGMALFQSAFAVAEDDLKAWLASLIGKSVEEFKAMPATTVIDVLDSLIKQEGITDFFARASKLASKAESSV